MTPPGPTPPRPRSSPRKPPPVEMEDLEKEPDTGQYPVPKRVKSHLRKELNRQEWKTAVLIAVSSIGTAFGGFRFMKSDFSESLEPRLRQAEMEAREARNDVRELYRVMPGARWSARLEQPVTPTPLAPDGGR